MQEKTKNPAQGGPHSEHYEGRWNGMDTNEKIFGTYETMVYCEMNALKYRLRVGKKKDQPIDQEIAKAEWYEAEARRLKLKLDRREGVYGQKVLVLKEPSPVVTLKQTHVLDQTSRDRIISMISQTDSAVYIVDWLLKNFKVEPYVASDRND